MKFSNNINEARAEHSESGGFLLDFGEIYCVTDDMPCEHRVFKNKRELMEYSFRLAEAGYDETRMGHPTEWRRK